MSTFQALLAALLMLDSKASFPIYSATCSEHYDCAFSIGQQAKQRIQQYIATYPNMQDLRLCLITGCSVDLRDLVLFNKAIWPQYYEEMEGLAAGRVQYIA